MIAAPRGTGKGARDMKTLCRASVIALILSATMAAAAAAQQTDTSDVFVPEVGQAGKDVVWVPSPPEMVEAMMDLGKVTPQDYVIDLGSGDGRNVIAAAKRGAQALGVEYNDKMVELSKRLAEKAGVAGRAQFVQADMYEADISKATMLALFLLPSNMLVLRDKFFNLRPGSRIVANTFTIQDWTSDEQITLDNCTSWCTAHLYIVPAKVGGTWRVPQGELSLTQEFQMLNGTLTANGQTMPVTGRLRGEQITLSFNGQELTGRVNGNRIEGTLRNGSAQSDWRATRSE
jgi:hypothetical protein